MTSQSDYIRSDELQDSAVPIAWLPRLFGVSERTIREWISKDNLTTFDYPLQAGLGRPAQAIRWGDIPSTENHPTRWHRR